jgi:hypothetical protein
MEHHRCARCRNPIRTDRCVIAPADGEDGWFHTDCWAEVCSAQQEEYRQSVQRLGLAALIAPYVSPVSRPLAAD